jgi:NAD+ kinase
MRNINKIKIFSNHTQSSKPIEEELTKLLQENNYELTEDFDLGIAIGGDGSFLKMVKQTNFNSNPYYIGINTGTLGFLQEIKPDKIKEFVESLNQNNYKFDEIGVLETTITQNEQNKKYYSLNELVMRDLNLNVFKSEIYVDKIKLENFAGDGLLIATSVGSSAYNISLNGALVYNTLHTLQINPISPLNTSAYRNLLNPVILPEKSLVEIIPEKKQVTIMIDGEVEKLQNVSKLECTVKDKKLKFLRMKEYEFINIVNEKFISNK